MRKEVNFDVAATKMLTFFLECGIIIIENEKRGKFYEKV